jgi:hypothetical protein
MQKEITAFYSQPQTGGAMPVYTGARRWGGGFFGSLARFALPLLKKFAGRAVNVASKTASDVLDGRRPIKDALFDNTLDEVRSIINKRNTSINKEGEGGDIFSNRKRSKHATALY